MPLPEPGTGELLPPHVVHVVAPPEERQHPERGEQTGDRHHGRQPPQAGLGGVHDEEQAGAGEDEERRDQVAQPRRREQAGGQGAVPAGAQAPDGHAEVEDGERQADREGELARHRRRHVPADDVAVAVELRLPVEQEQQGGHRAQRRDRERQVAQPAEGVGGEGQADEPADRDELEGDVVRDRDDQHEPDEPDDEQHASPSVEAARAPARRRDRGGDHGRRDGQQARDPDVERHDQQGRDHHVELVRGEAVVPVRCPARQAQLGQQVVQEVVGAPHVGAHVATGRRRVAQHQLGVHGGHDERRAPDDHDERDERLQRVHRVVADAGRSGRWPRPTAG